MHIKLITIKSIDKERQIKIDFYRIEDYFRLVRK